MNTPEQERRASERTPLGLSCVYMMQRPVGQQRWEFHEGLGRVLNMARGGMLLLLEHPPEVQHIIQVHIYHSNTDQTISLVQVAWTRRADNERHYWAGCKFLFGPYSLSQERICAPSEFQSPATD